MGTSHRDFKTVPNSQISCEVRFGYNPFHDVLHWNLSIVPDSYLMEVIAVVRWFLEAASTAITLLLHNPKSSLSRL